MLIAGYAVLDGFDLGVGTLYPFIGKNEDEKAVLRTSIGPVWDGNEVWLLTGGGALFAAFPPVYATVFSGFYLAMMLVLFCLIFRAVSLENRDAAAAGRRSGTGPSSWVAPSRRCSSAWPSATSSAAYPSTRTESSPAPSSPCSTPSRC